MSRRILITRRDWMQATGVSFDPAVGFWSTPLANMLDSRPQVVARAVDNRDPASTQFVVNLGRQYRVGMFAFTALRTTSMGTMQIKAGIDPAFDYNEYDSGVVSTWPIDIPGPDYDAWGRYTLSGMYLEDEYVALGMPRVFIPSSLFWVQYIYVWIRDLTAREPLTIGAFGAYDVWEPPINFTYDWSITPADESDITRVPRGSTYIDPRGIRRKLNLGFPFLPEDEIWSRGFGTMLAKGKSEPFWIVPFSDSSEITRFEKAAVYGLVSQDSVLSNPFFGQYALPVQIEQLY